VDRGRRVAAGALVALGLVVGSLALGAWWVQAVVTQEFPVLGSLALHSEERAVEAQLQAQSGAAGLSPSTRAAVTGALNQPSVRSALSSGNPATALHDALVRADPALTPVLAAHPLTLPPVGRSIDRELAQLQPDAKLGLGMAAALVLVGFALAVDRFRVLRHVGWWGVVAGGMPLLLGWGIPAATGLGQAHGWAGNVARAELDATVPLRALSETLCATGALLVAVGWVTPRALRRLSSAGPRPGDAGAVAGAAGAMPGAAGAMPGAAGTGARAALSSSRVDVRL